MSSQRHYPIKKCGIHSVRISTEITFQNNNWLYSCSKTSMLFSMQKYLIFGVYTNIPSAYLDVTASAFTLLTCIQRKIHTHYNCRNTCLCGVYPNYFRIFADVTASALPLLTCIQKNNTLLTPQSMFFHYLRIHKENTHSSQYHFLVWSYSKQQYLLVCSNTYLVEWTQISLSAYLLASQPVFSHNLRVYPKIHNTHKNHFLARIFYSLLYTRQTSYITTCFPAD
jgi:hypothetical protein